MVTIYRTNTHIHQNDEHGDRTVGGGIATPPYYMTSNGKDLYDALRDMFGKSTLIEHMRMEAIQYLVRCLEKGQLRQDLEKVKVICDRIIKETEEPCTS